MPPNTRSIHSPAIGAKIESLSYDADSGYIVIELDSGEELWVASCYEGYHIFSSNTISSNSNAAEKRPNIVS